MSDNILGFQYQSKNKYGCADPESNIYTGSYSYFIDVYNGLIIRDAPNGLEPISRYGIKAWTMAKCKYLLEDCEQYRIQGVYDPEHEVVMFIFAGLDTSTKAWVTEMMMFTEDENRWVGSTDLKSPDGSPADWFETLGDILVGWYNGKPYIHNTNPLRNNFFGKQYYPRVKFVVNNAPGLPKLYRAMSIHSNKVWEAPNNGDITVQPSVSYPYGMISRLKKNLFNTKDGIHHCAFRKSLLDGDGNVDENLLYKGRELRGNTLEVIITNVDDTGELVINEIIVNSVYPKRLRNG